MKKGLIKAGVLFLVFCASAVFFSMTSNRSNVDLTMQLEEATLPVVYTCQNNQKINQMFGYTNEMEAQYMRDNITPLREDLILPIEIETFDAKITNLSYEVRSLDTKRLIEETEVTDFSKEGKVLRANLHIQNLLKEGKEYLLILTLNSNEKKVNYYSRIIRQKDDTVAESIAFAKNFHEQTLHYDEEKSKVAMYLEPDTTEENNSLHHVSIHSNLSQVTWADFNGQQVGELRISVKEIQPTSVVVVLEYGMTSAGDSGESDFYHVSEYYRIRYSPDRTFLLDYDRTMSQVFEGENSAFNGNSLLLGIRDPEVEYAVSEDDSILTFVQEGSLWSYDQNDNKLATIFTFRSLEGMDERETNNDHGIHIIRVDNDGNVDFVVYGYMNRGNHEGEVGTGVYRYEAGSNCLQEKLFVPSTRSYEVMKESFGKLMYESTDQMFYLMAEGNIYEIDLKNHKEKLLQKDLPDGSYSISDSNRYVAWTDQEKGKNGNRIVLYDLEKQKSYIVEETGGNRVKPLGFMDSDFIYGVADKKDIKKDQSGSQLFPMYAVKIIDTESKSHEVLKEYQKPGFFVSDISISGNSINLKRMQYNGSAYVEADEDTIKNNEEIQEESCERITTINAGVRQTQVQLTLTKEVSSQAPMFLTVNDVIMEDDTTLQIEMPKTENKYYIYAKGHVIGMTNVLKEAISLADEKMGVVVNDAQTYMWNRAKSASRMPIPVEMSRDETSGQSVAQALSSMLSTAGIHVQTNGMLAEGKSPYRILKDTMKDRQVLDVSGCSLQQVLYYVDKGTPVFAMTGKDSALLLVGYDSVNISVFDAVSGKTEKMGMEDATNLFRVAGNQFLAYQ
ncbi:MAG: hypothetical protein ACI4HI_01730 [Lachnospiraceae bacterium]